MSKRNKLTPEDKLMKAIFGKTQAEYEAEIEKRDEEKANSVTDEEFKEIWGCTPGEHADKMMIKIGWMDAVIFYLKSIGKLGKTEFAKREISDIAKYFYQQGREDEKNGVKEYDRLWKLNREGLEEKEE